MFSEKDLSQIAYRGLTESIVLEQISQFKQDFPSLKIINAATLDNGILALNKDNLSELVNYYEKDSNCLKKVKFVPASGAASRMFKYLFEVLKSCDRSEEKYLEVTHNKRLGSFKYIYENKKRFAFFNDLENLEHSNMSKYEDISSRSITKKFLTKLLTVEGLNYANLPKGLLKFHKNDKGTRTCAEEHLVEGFLYARSGEEVNLHFTVSESHLELFNSHLEEIVGKYEKKFGIKYNINLSTQKTNTDTIAVDLDNNPFRDTSGNILFRPGGHGALLQNLNAISADLIFVKNIDNVVQDRVKKDTVLYKKALAGLLLKLRKNIFDWIIKLNDKNPSKYINEVISFVSHRLNIKFPIDFEARTNIQKINFLIKKLNRPIRICGMVKNEDEPGGGPFWVENNDKSVSLQIVESSQIHKDKNNLMKNATHFNSVDLICSTIDYEGKKFDLDKFTDPNTGFISEKSLEGRSLKALELPGLWNGAMANWNTVFVEVPVSTFAPVKTISDLLREEHLCESDLMLKTN